MTAKPKHQGRLFGLTEEEVIEKDMQSIEEQAFEAVRYPKEEKKSYDLRQVLKMMRDI